MFLWYPVLDLARAPRRAARKKGSGYENVLSNELMRYFINTSIATTVMKLRQRTASSPGSSMCVGFAPLRSEGTRIFPLLLSTHVSPERPSRAGDEAGPGTVQHQTKPTSAFLVQFWPLTAVLPREYPRGRSAVRGLNWTSAFY
jgi:hypothetical protein